MNRAMEPSKNCPDIISTEAKEPSSQLGEIKSFAAPLLLTRSLLSLEDENECLRAKVVNRLRILDTSQSDENFDRLSRLASRYFETPAVCITIIDNNRIWMKSTFGLDVSEVNFDLSVGCTRQRAAVFERHKAFCSYTILPNAPAVFVVENAAEDPVFSKNPFVSGDAHIRFYAGAPIICDCVKIGTVCVLDNHPRPDFDENKKETLRLFSDAVASLVKQYRQETLTDVDANVHRIDSVILKGLKEPLETLHVLHNQLTDSIEQSLASNRDDVCLHEQTDGSQVLAKFEKFEDGIHQWQAITNASLQFALAVTHLDAPPSPCRQVGVTNSNAQLTSSPSTLSVATATISSLQSSLSSPLTESHVLAESGNIIDFYHSLIGKCAELRQLHKSVVWSAPELAMIATNCEGSAQHQQQILTIDYDLLEKDDDLGGAIDTDNFEGTLAAIIGYLSLMNFRQFDTVSLTVHVDMPDLVDCNGEETACTSNHSMSLETAPRSNNVSNTQQKKRDFWEILEGEDSLDIHSDDRMGAIGEDPGSQDGHKRSKNFSTDFARSPDFEASSLGSNSGSSLALASWGNSGSRILSPHLGAGDHFSMIILIEFEGRSRVSDDSTVNQNELQDEAEQLQLLETLVNSLGGEIEADLATPFPSAHCSSKGFRLIFPDLIHWKDASV